MAYGWWIFLGVLIQQAFSIITFLLSDEDIQVGFKCSIFFLFWPVYLLYYPVRTHKAFYDMSPLFQRALGYWPHMFGRRAKYKKNSYNPWQWWDNRKKVDNDGKKDY